MKSKSLHIFRFLILCYISLIHGQEKNSANYQFKNFSIDEGLSQSSVLSIYQDHKGFIWLGTRDGLNRFDGISFKVFKNNPNDKFSIENNYIKKIKEAPDSTLYIGTNKGLSYFKRETNQFIKLVDIDKKLDNTVVWDFVFQENTIWIGTDKGLISYDKNTKRSTKYVFNFNPNGATHVRCLMLDHDNNLWLKTPFKVAKYCKEQNIFEYFDIENHNQTESSKIFKPYLFQDSKKTIWLGFDKGLCFLKDKTFVSYTEKINNKSIDSEVRVIKEDLNNNLWIGTYQGGYILDAKRKLISHIKNDNILEYSLSQNSIYDIYEDKKGDIWIGTYAGGLNFFDRNFASFNHISAGNNTSKLNYNVVSSIVEDNKFFWIGTEGGGLNRYDKKTGTFRYFTADKTQQGLNINNIKCLLLTQNNQLWIGTHDGGINIKDLKRPNKPIQKITTDNKDIKGLKSNRVITLLEEFDNQKIWIGTSNSGLQFYDIKEKNIKPILQESNRNQLIYSLIKSKKPYLIWVGTENGLNILDSKTNALSSIDFYPDQNIIDSKNTSVISLYEDDNENLWIGTEGQGLFFFDPNLNKTIHYGTAQGLPNQVICNIIADNKKNIWITTNKGISKLNLLTKKIKNYDNKDGLANYEFSYNAGILSQKNKLIFGGINGLSIFEPNKISNNNFIPPVVIDNIEISNDTLFHIGKKNRLIELTAHQNTFKINFNALNFTQSQKNKYRYKLIGFDKDWTETQNINFAQYRNIPAGNYTFNLKAANNDGLWNEKGTQIAIRIAPPFWKTWWAYTFYLTLFISAFLFFRKYTLLRIKERNELKNERIEKERIKEINQMKLKLFTNISHEFRTPLTLIIGPLKKILENKELPEQIKKQHEVMNKNANTLLQLINQILDFRKSESGKLSLQAKRLDIVKCINEEIKSFELLIEEKKIKFEFDSDEDEILLWFDEVKIKKVIINLLSNAFKFTPDRGQIKISVSKIIYSKKYDFRDALKIEVKDSGKGIPKKEIKHIFKRYHQLNETDNLNLGSGIGLALSQNLIKLHHGKIVVESDGLNKGTVFKCFLPLGKDHLSKDEITADSYNEDSNLEKAIEIEEAINISEVPEKPKENKANILIVDDNKQMREFIKDIFEEQFNVFMAENGKSALDISMIYDINIIVSDLMMPIMDGLELCQRIKENIKTSHIPVILLTAKSSDESQKTGFKTGANAYITKPFDPEVLAYRVQNILETRGKYIEKFKKDEIMEPKNLDITSADEKFLASAIEIVEKNLSNPDFNMSVLIDEMNMSRSVLYRKLKAITGQSITEFIRTIKLKKAGQMLVATDMNVSEIAYELGFNDLKHFRKSFKQVFHQLPSQYRVQKRENED